MANSLSRGKQNYHSTRPQLPQGNGYAAVAHNEATTGMAVDAVSRPMEGEDESTMDAEGLKSRLEQVGTHGILGIMAIY